MYYTPFKTLGGEPLDGRTHTFAGYTAGLLLVQAQIFGAFGLPAPDGILPCVGMVGLSMAGSLA